MTQAWDVTSRPHRSSTDTFNPTMVAPHAPHLLTERGGHIPGIGTQQDPDRTQGGRYPGTRGPLTASPRKCDRVKGALHPPRGMSLTKGLCSAAQPPQPWGLSQDEAGMQQGGVSPIPSPGRWSLLGPQGQWAGLGVDAPLPQPPGRMPLSARSGEVTPGCVAASGPLCQSCGC